MQEPAEPPHALVVGASGMLAGAALHLARTCRVSAIARTPDRLEALRAGAPERIHPVPLDYRDTARLEVALREAIAGRGSFSIALCWVHSTAPDAIPTIVRCLGEQARAGEPPRLFHVRGMPGVGNDGIHEHIEAAVSTAGVHYRCIQLGFAIEGARSRWLTHDEISTGAIAAIEGDVLNHVIGVTAPIERMP